MEMMASKSQNLLNSRYNTNTLSYNYSLSKLSTCSNQFKNALQPLNTMKTLSTMRSTANLDTHNFLRTASLNDLVDACKFNRILNRSTSNPTKISPPKSERKLEQDLFKMKTDYLLRKKCDKNIQVTNPFVVTSSRLKDKMNDLIELSLTKGSSKTGTNFSCAYYDPIQVVEVDLDADGEKSGYTSNKDSTSIYGLNEKAKDDNGSVVSLKKQRSNCTSALYNRKKKMPFTPGNKTITNDSLCTVSKPPRTERESIKTFQTSESKKTLSEQRKDIYDLLLDNKVKPASEIKAKFKKKALEIESSPFVMYESSKVNTFKGAPKASSKKYAKTADVSQGVDKINLASKMFSMKLGNNFLSNRKEQPEISKKNLQNTSSLKTLSHNGSRYLAKKSEKEYQIKNKINEIKKFKFSKNIHCGNTKERAEEIKENNLKLMSVIKEKMIKTVKSMKPSEANGNEGKGEKQPSEFEDIDINIE